MISPQIVRRFLSYACAGETLRNKWYVGANSYQLTKGDCAHLFPTSMALLVIVHGGSIYNM